MAFGLDYVLANTRYGHDTSYSPDGTSVSGWAGYSHAGANRAIGQPKLAPIVMAGMTFRF